jgi:hypothetical protein
LGWGRSGLVLRLRRHNIGVINRCRITNTKDTLGVLLRRLLRFDVMDGLKIGVVNILFRRTDGKIGRETKVFLLNNKTI